MTAKKKARMLDWSGYAIIDTFGEAVSYPAVFAHRSEAKEVYDRISKYPGMGPIRIARVAVTEIVPTLTRKGRR